MTEKVLQPLFHISTIDYTIIGIYFLFVIGIGYILKKYMKTGLDFFLSGRTIPTWVAGLAFLSANLGALEILGMAGSSYKYGVLVAHFYWIGAIPAMLFLAVFMMPFYYGSKARSVPEYLVLRYNEPTRAVNAISFAIMTLLMSGISMYAMALIFQILLGWDMNASIWLSSIIILVYITFGGLTSSIYNEVVQFFLIWLGLLPLPILALKEVGGWDNLLKRIPEGFTHLWSVTGTANANPMGIEFLGIALGLGFVLSFGYWCTDFLVVQRAFSTRNIHSAQQVPIMASFFKMFIPILVVLTGLLALALFPNELGPTSPGKQPYDMALPLLINRYYPIGMIGLGITALLASFMSGMAGNVTAFTTVWTYDIYEAYINKNASDKHYLWMGRVATIAGVILSIGTAYIAMQYNSIMDFMQTIFGFFNAPLFATFLLGMFWKRATGWGGFVGLVSGIVSAALMFFLILPDSVFASSMAGNFWRAWWAWLICFIVTILVSLVTKPKTDEELKGLVYGNQNDEQKEKINIWYKKPETWAFVAAIILIILNIKFW